MADFFENSRSLLPKIWPPQPYLGISNSEASQITSMQRKSIKRRMIGGSNIIKHINLLGKKVDEGGQTNTGRIAEKAF